MAFSMTIYCKFTVKSDLKQSTFGKVRDKKANSLTCSVCLSTVLLKDELTRDFEKGKKQPLLTVVTSILSRLGQLSNW